MSEITRDLLMTYADGSASEAERRAVEAHLANAPDAAADVALMERQNEAIRILFDPAGGESVPPRLKPRRLAAEIAGRRSRQWRLAAAALVLMGLGLGSGWLARPLLDRSPPPSAILIADAVNAHTVYTGEGRHAVEVGSAESEHLSTWLSSRLHTGLAMPDLSAEGFALVGGRLLPGAPDAGGRAAQLMYEDVESRRITIYVTAALPDGEPAYQFTSLDGSEAFYWANARITCTVVGSLPAEQMEAVAGAVYSQLTAAERGDSRPYRG